MKALIRLVVICFVALFSLSGSIVLISASQSDYAPMPELHHCEIGICVWGMIPETTAYMDAYNIIDDNPDFDFLDSDKRHAYKKSNPHYVLHIYPFSVSGDFSSGTVVEAGEIQLMFPVDQTEVTAASIIAQLGVPCVTMSPSDMVMMYPGAVFMFKSDALRKPQRLELTSPLLQIRLYRNAPSCPAMLKKYPAGKWRGFTSYCRYNEIQSQYLALYQNLPFEC
jgi:hypothetical protein